MERVWKEEDKCIDFSSDFCVVDKVLDWLEREDSDVEKLVGYGLCLAAVTYFVARLFQSFVS